MDLVNVQDICDLIISAIPVQCIVPVIFVHSVLTDEDRNHILNHRLVVKQSKVEIEKIFVRHYEEICTGTGAGESKSRDSALPSWK